MLVGGGGAHAGSPLGHLAQSFPVSGAEGAPGKAAKLPQRAPKAGDWEGSSHALRSTPHSKPTTGRQESDSGTRAGVRAGQGPSPIALGRHLSPSKCERGRTTQLGLLLVALLPAGKLQHPAQQAPRTSGDAAGHCTITSFPPNRLSPSGPGQDPNVTKRDCS